MMVIMCAGCCHCFVHSSGMPLRLPPGLLEISGLLLASRGSLRVISRSFHSATATSEIIYPARLSIDGKQPPVRTREDLQDEQSHSSVFQQPIAGLSEEELKAIYQDLLRHDVPPPTPSPEQSFVKSIPDPALVVPRLTRRIVKEAIPEIDTLPSSLSSKLRSRLSPTITEPRSVYHSQDKPYSELLNALQKDEFSPALPILGDGNATSRGVMTLPEWTALIEACLQEHDVDGAFTTLRVMKNLGTLPPWELLEHILYSLSQEGLFREIQAFAKEFITERNDQPHFQYIITALCKCRLYSTAVQLLHTQESKGHYPPMVVYQALITGFMRSPAPGNLPRRAQAWDLFYHMRYVAHPNPSVALYTDMIRACADTAGEPETLRGFDLWTEMTVDKRLTPTTDSYNAIITLAARSKPTALDATRFAKEMLELGRDASGKPALPLTMESYVALLEAAKRLGDLKQARWILMKLAKNGPEGSSAVNQWALRHMFHTYAMYNPPFKREFANTVKAATAARRKQDKEQKEAPPHVEVEDTVQGLPEIVQQGPQSKGYKALLPQTSRAVLAEADALFDLFVREKGVAQLNATGEPQEPRLFSSILNAGDIAQAYLSVYLHHSPHVKEVIEKARSIHAQLGIEWSAETIRLCMIHCARRTTASSLPLTEVFTRELWQKWLDIIEAEKPWISRWIPGGPTTPAERRVIPRSSLKASNIASIWAAYIQLAVRTNRIDEAMDLVRLFEKTYPPSDSKSNLCPDMPTGSRVGLEGPRTLLKVTPRGLIDDDSVPPILVFTDIAPLHKSLLQKTRTKDLGYLTYLLHAYAGGVRDRRGMNLLVKDVNEGWRGKKAIGNEDEAKIEAKLKYGKRKRSGRQRPGLRRR